MGKEVSKQIKVDISEEQTIVELSKSIQAFDSEIFLKKNVSGSVIEINLKSFLGLINLRLTNGDLLTVRAVGDDCEEALQEVVDYLT
ncbi:HPr family phosphocarrier protein [Bacillaceae bacterium S4-13-58]